MPSPEKTRLVLTGRDTKQASTNISFWVPALADDEITPMALDNAEVESLISAVQAVSDLAIPRASLQSIAYDETTGAAEAAYADAEDKMVLYFEGGTSINGGKVTIPGPDPSCFAADGETVDPTVGIVSDLIVAILALALEKGGAALAEYLRGTRDRKKNRKVKPGV